MPHARLTLPLPPGFRLTDAVCSYGYFLLAPNRWNPATRRLVRVLHGEGDRVVRVELRQSPGARTLSVATDQPALSAVDRSRLRAQVRRMLRLDEDPAIFRDYQRLDPWARRTGFARMFRSPTLFEDILKTMSSCNVAWPSTMRMNTLLCERIGGGAFPTPSALAPIEPDRLRRTCGVGYRAQRMVRLAREVCEGRLDLDGFEDRSRPTQDIYERLLSIHGIGPYAASNICHLLGRYDRLAIDTETYRHFRQVHGIKTPETSAGLRRLHLKVQRHYRRFAPYQFLAYWHELWRHYERRVGPAQTWDAVTHGPNFTASKLG